jgi:hypothetical protein
MIANLYRIELGLRRAIVRVGRNSLKDVGNKRHDRFAETVRREQFSPLAQKGANGLRKAGIGKQTADFCNSVVFAGKQKCRMVEYLGAST